MHCEAIEVTVDTTAVVNFSKYKSVNGCGGEINAESGQLKSPNFPNNYGNNKDCSWVINVPAGLAVILDFATPFDVSYNCISFFLVQKSNKNNFLSTYVFFEFKPLNR